MAPIFIDANQAAAMLGLPNGDALTRIRIRLEDEAGFPVPVPHWRRPLKWRRDQVEGWLAAQGRPRPIAQSITPGGNVILMAEARRA